MTLQEDKQLQQLERKVETLNLYIDIFNTQSVHTDSSTYQLALSELLTQIFVHQSKAQLFIGTLKCKEYFQHCGKINPQFDVYVQQIKHDKEPAHAVQVLMRILMKQKVIQRLLQFTKCVSKQETLKYYHENAFLITKRQLFKDFLEKQGNLTFDITVEQFNEEQSKQCLRDIRNMVQKYQSSGQAHGLKPEETFEMLLDFNNENNNKQEKQGDIQTQLQDNEQQPQVQNDPINPLDEIFGFTSQVADNTTGENVKNTQEEKNNHQNNKNTDLLDFNHLNKNHNDKILDSQITQEDNQDFGNKSYAIPTPNLISSNVHDTQYQLFHTQEQTSAKSHLNIPTLLELLARHLQLKVNLKESCFFDNNAVFTIGVFKLITAVYGHKSIEFGYIKLFQKASKEPAMAYLKHILSNQFHKDTPDIQLKKLIIQILNDNTISVLHQVNDLKIFEYYYNQSAYLCRSSFLEEFNNFLDNISKHIKFQSLDKFNFSAKVDQLGLKNEILEMEQAQMKIQKAFKSEQHQLAPLQLNENQEVTSVIQNLDNYLLKIQESLQHNAKKNDVSKEEQLDEKKDLQINNSNEDERGEQSTSKDLVLNNEPANNEQMEEHDKKHEENDNIIDTEPNNEEKQQNSITSEQIDQTQEQSQHDTENTNKIIETQSPINNDELQIQEQNTDSHKATEQNSALPDDHSNNMENSHQSDNKSQLQENLDEQQSDNNEDITIQLSQQFQVQTDDQFAQKTENENNINQNTTLYLNQFNQQLKSNNSSSEEELVISELQNQNIDITKSQTKNQLQFQQHQGYYVNFVLILQQITQQFDIQLDSNQMETLIQLQNSHYNASKIFSKSQQLLSEGKSRTNLHKQQEDSSKIKIFNHFSSQTKSKQFYEITTYDLSIQPQNEKYFQITEFEQNQLLQNEKMDTKRSTYDAIYSRQISVHILQNSIQTARFATQANVDTIKFHGKLNNLVLQKTQSFINKQFYDPDDVVKYSENKYCSQCGKALNDEESEIWPCLYSGLINCLNCTPQMSYIPGLILNGCFEQFMVSESSKLQIQKQLNAPLILTDCVPYPIKANKNYCEFIRLRKTLLYLYLLYQLNGTPIEVSERFYEDFNPHITQILRQYQQKQEFEPIVKLLNGVPKNVQNQSLEHSPARLLGPDHEYLGLLAQAQLYQESGRIAIVSSGYVTLSDLIDVCTGGSVRLKLRTGVARLYRLFQAQRGDSVRCSACKGQLEGLQITRAYVCNSCGEISHQNCVHQCEFQ